MSDSAVLEVDQLYKTFRLGFWRKRVEAVRGVSFRVERGETFGLLGPNGAGKTTTLKMVLRLIFPDAGQVRLFGAPLRSTRGLSQLGYLPENPYVYQYLKPLEFLDLCGRLVNMPVAARRKRSAELVERVGLGHAVDRPIGRFSKGMMQRIGLAQALLHDPELLILDEPMSGLDPIGRKQVREVIEEQRAAGKTLIFTSHILSDVEMLCDRVAIMRRGQVVDAGSLDSLLNRDARRVELELRGLTPALRAQLEGRVSSMRDVDDVTHLVVEGEPELNPLLDEVMRAGVQVVAVQPQRESLEDLFVRHAMAGGEEGERQTPG